jgi:chorismate-pyruvate lyase
MSGTARWGLAVCAVLLSSFGAKAAPEARIAAFEAQLEANPSATAVLQAWCDAHARAGTRIVARQVQPAPIPPSADARRALAIKPGEAVRYRRVQLVCGGRVLSNADNWYLPGELTAAMNDALEHTQTPFGRAVAALHFGRRNLETVYLPPGDQDVLRHSAVLLTDKGQPFSFVVETYTREILVN